MGLREALYKPQLPKASHYKRDKEMRKGNIAPHGCKIYKEKILITLEKKKCNLYFHRPNRKGIEPLGRDILFCSNCIDWGGGGGEFISFSRTD